MPTPPGRVPRSGAETRTRVENRNQNVNLKAAWANLGLGSIFRVGSPFHDPTGANNGRIVVPTDPPDTRRICLPMALTGACYSNCAGKHEALTDAEVQKVARAGSLQVN